MNMADHTFEHYLFGLGVLVREHATEAKINHEQNPDDFSLGQLIAWHRIVSLMKSQAFAYNIDDKKLGLEGIDPDRDLI